VYCFYDREYWDTEFLFSTHSLPEVSELREIIKKFAKEEHEDEDFDVFKYFLRLNGSRMLII